MSQTRFELFLLRKMIGWTCLSHCVFKERNPQEYRWAVADCGTGRECGVNGCPEKELRTGGLWEEMSQGWG